jgi:hypothetical protein
VGKILQHHPPVIWAILEKYAAVLKNISAQTLHSRWLVYREQVMTNGNIISEDNYQPLAPEPHDFCQQCLLSNLAKKIPLTDWEPANRIF